MSFTFESGGVRLEANMRGREIQRKGVSVGYAFVVVIDGITWTKDLFTAFVRGGARNVDGKISYTKIEGHRVALVKSASGSIAMYRPGDRIVFVIGTSMKSAKRLITSIINAN